jgi:iduronate 2-sulfatase
MEAPGRISHATVETVDVFPTLTDLCGIPAPQGLDGKSLLPQLNDAAAPTAKPAHGFWTDGQRTIRTDRWRLIVQSTKEDPAARVELFDYETDPEETRNHAEANPEVVRELIAQLQRAPQPGFAAASSLEVPAGQ